MKETEKNKQEEKRASFDFLQHFITTWWDLDVHMTYTLSIWMTTRPLIYFLLGYLVWKKNIKYHWVVICKIYKQVIKYSFVQAGMVVINSVFVDCHLCVYLLQASW